VVSSLKSSRKKHPDLVRRMILAATSAAGGEGVSNVGAVLQNAVARATAEKKHPKQSLFFTQSHDGQKAAAEFLQRLGTRQQDRDLPASQETIVAQVTAITKWGMAPKPTSLDSIQHPVLVANGDTDLMVPSINSVELARKLPHSQLSIFPDAGHGAIFQYHSAFLDQTLRFLQNYLDAALSVHRQTSMEYQVGAGDTTEEVLVVESPPARDAIVPQRRFRRIDWRMGPWCQEEA
jgi:pimeloyl-ACP methyl ester carboxylesterase